MAEQQLIGYVERMSVRQVVKLHLHYETTMRTFILKDLHGTRYELTCYNKLEREFYDNIHLGDKVMVFFDIVPREYNGKFYYTLRVSRFGTFIRKEDNNGQSIINKYYDIRKVQLQEGNP